MGGYGTIGVLLFFGVLILGAVILQRSHSIKIALDDEELKRATTIIRFRNLATCLGLTAISFHLILVSGLQLMSKDEAGYATRETTATYLLYSGVALLATAAYLLYISRQPEFNFERSLQKFAVKEKIKAGIKFPQKPKSVKRRRSTRV